MRPIAAAREWDLPVLESIGELASWLRLTPGELEWLADLKGLERRKNSPRLRHYHYRILLKVSGRVRLLEAPKPRLKEVQRLILARILDRIQPHPAAHGFIKGRSIKTFVAPHVGRNVILRMDVQDFFPCLIGARIQALFRTLGYPESVADLLGGLCTNAAPRDVWNSPTPLLDVDPTHVREARALYARVHLPQGAPTSPTLANLCAYRMDCRLSGLARSVGAQYTRYADDLAFSGQEDFDRCLGRFSTHVAAILQEEGFAVHHRKTRIMRQGVRQHLAGLVANERINVFRADFDRLKATLTNCVRHGPDSQNQDAHPRFRAYLEGRVGFVEMVNASKGQRLRKIFDQIRWP
jgi:retron-type reverse transcriptase